MPGPLGEDSASTGNAIECAPLAAFSLAQAKPAIGAAPGGGSWA